MRPRARVPEWLSSRTPDKKTQNIKAALKAGVDQEGFTLKLASEPSPVRGYQRVAVKVVDVNGNKSTVVRKLAT